MIDFETKHGKKSKGLTDAEAEVVIGSPEPYRDLSELYRRPNPVVRAYRTARSFVADLAFGIHLIITGRD